jgi:transcriptional regulator with XRE-family HTH domain
LRVWREYKELSQNDLEKRLGLTRYYISRVENSITIPTLETLERFARALEVPVFHLVYEEEDPYPPPILPESARLMRASRNLSKRELGLLEQFNLLFGRFLDRDRELLVSLARRMTKRMSLWSPVEDKRKPRNNTQPLRTDRSRRIPRRENPNIRSRSFSTKPRMRKKIGIRGCGGCLLYQPSPFQIC